MATASAYRTEALGGVPFQRMGLPSPSAMGMGAGPTGPQPPKSPMGMDYSGKFRTGPANYQPGRNRPVGQILAQRENQYSSRYDDGTPVPAGMPINVAGYRSSGLQRGGRIGSAAGALGSSGIPTSQRGRMEKYGVDPTTGEGAWQMPTWMVGQQQRDQFGLTPDWAYGGMGKLPYTSASPAGSQPKPADSSKSMNPIAPLRNMGANAAPMAPSSVYNMSTGGGFGIPSSFFGTTVQDMLNRANFIW